MKKALKIIFRAISGIIILIILLPIVVNIILQIAPVQNLAVRKITNLLSNITGTQVTIKHVDLEFFSSAKLTGIFFADNQKDTLIYAEKLSIDINSLNFFTGAYNLGEVKFTNAKVNLTQDSTGILNITEVFKHLKNPNANFNVEITANELVFENAEFKYQNLNAKDSTTTQKGLNLQNIKLENININAQNIAFIEDNVWMDNLKITLNEKQKTLKLQELKIKRSGVDSSGLYLEGIKLKTQHSNIKLRLLNLKTLNKKWTDWRKFNDSILIACQIADSKINTQTISKIIGIELPQYNNININSGVVNGKINNLNALIYNIEYINNKLNLNAKVKGLPDIQNTNLELNINKLNTTGQDIVQTINSVSNNPISAKNTKILNNLKDINIQIQIKGKLDSLEGKTNIEIIDIGKINSKFLAQNLVGKEKRKKISGKINTENLKLYNIVKHKTLGTVSLEGEYTAEIGENKNPKYSTNIQVSALDWNGYRHNDIDITGLFEDGVFNGNFNSYDKNFRVNVSGKIDFNQQIPHYEFGGKIDQINLSELGMNKRDSIALLSATITANGTGMTIDDFNGSGTIDSIKYINPNDTIKTSQVRITSLAAPRFKELEVNSEFLDIKFRGSNSFEQIVDYIERSAQRFMPQIPRLDILSNYDGLDYIQTDQTTPIEEGYYQLSVRVKEANNVAAAFVPSLEVAQGSELNLLFNPAQDQFSLRVSSNFISSDDVFIENLEIDSRNIDDSISVYSTAGLLIIEGAELPNFSLVGGVSSRAASLSAQFKDNNNQNYALISTYSKFTRNKNGSPRMIMDISPTTIVLDDMQWNISPTTVEMDSTAITINDLAVYSKEGRFELNGKASKNTKDTLELTLKNAKLEPLSIFIQHLGYKINGTASGKVNLIAALGERQMLARIKLDQLGLNGKIIGNPEIKTTINTTEKQINFIAGNNLNTTNTPVSGYYNIGSKKLNIDFRFDSIPIQYIDPMVDGILSDNQGTVKAELNLTAQNGQTLLNGMIGIKELNTTIDFTKARYRVTPCQIEVKNSSFFLPTTTITDTEGETGTLSAQITTKNFMDIRYRVRADFTDLMALNTTAQNNSDFYGKAYGTGFVEVDGDHNNAVINIVGQTAKNSNIVMPFSGAATIEQAEFIRFTNPRKDSLEKNKEQLQTTNYLSRFKARQAAKKQKTNLKVNLNIEVLPNLLAELEMDAKMGDIIRARGQGRLLMNIDPNLDVFTMEGPVEITEGNYLFTLQTIINKRFTIEPGSQIIWTGEPVNPDVNLTAIYKLKTSLTPLTGDVGENTTANIECGIQLTDKLLSPTINFTINAPSADAEIQNALRNSLNTQEALSMQFLSLMLANSFIPDMGTSAIGTMSSSIMGITGLEFLSNQLSNLISSDKVSFRIGYKPLSETTSDEFSAAVGAQIIADVLSLEVDGNYNVGNNTSLSNQNPFSVDAYLTWNINKSGSLKLKGFTRTIDRFDETQGMQENGAGVYFRQDFHDFKDLQKRLKNTFQRDSTKTEKRKARRAEKKEEKSKNKEK